MIPVTKPFLPPKQAYIELLNQIWDRNILTNNGPYVIQLEQQLKQYLKLTNSLYYVSNGTIALQLAIKALGLKGEIITTPFSYVATTSVIAWEECTPVFVDIDPDTLNINPDLIEERINEKTVAILATHVYGNPCQIDRIELIARKFGLKVIYDAAHSFGVRYMDNSIFSYGDVSTASFHSTKLFHTVEGGAVFTNNDSTSEILKYMRNFGHIGDDYKCIGVNAKNSELHAAMGIIVLRYIDQILEIRKSLSETYDTCLIGLNLKKPSIDSKCDYNYAYYPVIFRSEDILLKTLAELAKKNIVPRRYFYPSLSNLPYVKKYDTLVADDICRRVLCLPLYFDLQVEQIELIASIMLDIQD